MKLAPLNLLVMAEKSYSVPSVKPRKDGLL